MNLFETKAATKIGLTFVCGIFLLLVACAPADNDTNTVNTSVLDLTKDTPFYIINGQEIKQSADGFSYSIVALFNIEDSSLCTGSIIDPNYIITAAHCLARDPRNMVVLFGVDFEAAAKSKNFIPVADGIANPLYNHKMDLARQKKAIPEKNWGDIALIKIGKRLPPNYRPIPVVNLTDTTAQQETLLAGYGMYNGVKGTGSGLLRKTIVKIDNPSYSQTEASLDQTHGTGACHGDSGGPSYIKANTGGYALWGVTSRGLNDPKNDCSQFSVYTKITPFRNWIIQAQKLLATRVLPPHIPLPPKTLQGGNRLAVIPK